MSGINRRIVLTESSLSLLQYCRGAVLELASRVGSGHHMHTARQLAESHPATAEKGTQIWPSMDVAFSYPCCCYPPMHFLQPGQQGHLPDAIVEAIEQETRQPWSCHLIRASCPGQEGCQLRVSTTFVENIFMRRLTTVQGQFFIMLKYLIKHVISKRCVGLKSYHAKTLVFHMVHQSPAELWRPENLVQLVQQALNTLMESFRTETGLLEHFFVLDALVYLKKSASVHSIVTEVERVLKSLRPVLTEFKKLLVPIGESSAFSFHPFAVLPLYFLETPALATPLEFHHIYMVVKDAVLSLAQQAEFDQSAFEELISQLPECAYTAREALRVLAALRSRDEAAAKDLLRRRFVQPRHRVTRMVPYMEGVDQSGLTDFLEANDSAWKFCFRFEQPISMDWLPSELLREQFPARMIFYDKRFFANFAMLINSLLLELLPDYSAQTGLVDAWFEELKEEEADFEELFAFACYTSRLSHLRFVREKMLGLSYSLSKKFKKVTCKMFHLVRTETQ